MRRLIFNLGRSLFHARNGLHAKGAVIGALGFVLCSGLVAQMPPVPAALIHPPDRVGPLKLQDMPLEQIFELLERWTGKAILRPQTLPATTFNLNLPVEVSSAEGVRAIETLLSLNGLAISSLDQNFLKVTPINAAKNEAPELIAGSTLELAPSGRIASKLFKPHFIRVSEFMPQITSLLNPTIGSPPVVFEKSNFALITDSISNLQRIETVLLQVDSPQTSHITPKFYQLHYSKASEDVQKLHNMLSGTLANDLGSTTFSADDRANQIILFADPKQYPIFDELICKLDVRSGEDTRTEMIYLNHASANDVAATLTQLISGQNNPAKAPLGSAASASEPIVVREPGLAKQQAETDTLATMAKTSPSGPTKQFSALLTVLPEQRSNAVIVSGTEDDIREIKRLISQIDVLLAQVRIEVVIAEVTLDDNHTSGISALGLKLAGDRLVGFSGSASGVGVSNGTVTYPSSAADATPVSGPWDLAAEISLSTTPRKTNTRILSVPNIITTHNKAGKIFVGQEVPVISSYLSDTSAVSGGVGAGYRSTINSKDIGIQLSVKPLIGPDQSVQMEISQEVNDILGETLIDGNQQPTIGRRTTESFVSAHSGEIIVLGGLQRSSKNSSTSRLGPIPILGTLLGTRTRDDLRTDLIFFLRPTIMKPSPEPLEPIIKRFPSDQRKDLKSLLDLPETQNHP